MSENNNHLALQAMKILIVDDEPVNISLMEQVLEELGYTTVKGVTDSRLALPLLSTFEPDLILLDLMMPHIDGYGVLEQIAQVVPSSAYLPVLVMTADAHLATKRRALAAGATDFLTKPFDTSEMTLRIKNLLRTRWQHLQLQNQNQVLEGKVRERTHELEASQLETLERLALAADYRDDDTGLHTRRVGRTAALLARTLGLPEDEVETIQRAAPLHDVGKIGTPDEILLKPDKLTPAEFNVIKTHTTTGAKILSGSSSPLLQLAEAIALTHHERWDGNGYPVGLAGETIPLAGRIVAVADVFDALTHMRPYKPVWPVEEAVAEIQRSSGRQFDPRVVEAFLTLPHSILI